MRRSLEALVLQPQIHAVSAGRVVAAAGTGLVSAAPAGPVQDLVRFVVLVPDEADDEVADLGEGKLGQLASQVPGPPFSPLVAARVTVRKACAQQARVMCRYQAS